MAHLLRHVVIIFRDGGGSLVDEKVRKLISFLRTEYIPPGKRPRSWFKREIIVADHVTLESQLRSTEWSI